MARAKPRTDETYIPMAPATTIEGRENQMIALAVNLAEQKLLDGTASTPIITHYLKLASTREQLEKERLRRENDLLTAKAVSIQSGQNAEQMYADAIAAMRAYGGDDND